MRRPNNEDENILIELEDSLGLAKYSSEELSIILRKFSTDNKLNQNQLIEFLSSMQLMNVRNQKYLVTFYDLFRTENGKYLLKPLLILVILMGNSPSHIKAKLLFETYDIKNSKEISIDTLQEIIDVMLSICIDKLPILSEIKVYSTSTMKEYTQILKKNRFIAKKHILRLFLPFDNETSESVFKDQFMLNCYKEEPAAKLLTPQGLRTFIYLFN